MRGGFEPRKSTRHPKLKKQRTALAKDAAKGRRRFKLARVTKSGQPPEVKALRPTKTKRLKKPRS